MSASTLEQVKDLVNKLTPYEQAKLLEYLTPRIAQMLSHTQPKTSQAALDLAWQKLFDLGDAIAATDEQTSETLTQAVLNMRR